MAKHIHIHVGKRKTTDAFNPQSMIALCRSAIKNAAAFQEAAGNRPGAAKVYAEAISAYEKGMSAARKGNEDESKSYYTKGNNLTRQAHTIAA
jgi:hypothetical protein